MATWCIGIDWTVIEAIATVIGVLVTGCGVFMGWRALDTWKHQIKLQDCYQKIDRLLESYRSCLLAGHEWQWKLGVGENRTIQEAGETIEFYHWRSALMDYRLAFLLASPYLGKCKCKINELNFSPDHLQKEIIGAGLSLRQQETSLDFFNTMDNLSSRGLREIQKYREAKFVN